MCAGEDVRCQIIAKLKDPDAVNGQMERWSTDNVWWNTIPAISWETGTPIQEEWEFGLHQVISKTWMKLNKIGGYHNGKRKTGHF